MPERPPWRIVLALLAAIVAVVAFKYLVADPPTGRPDPPNTAPGAATVTVPDRSDGSVGGDCDEQGRAHHVYPDTPSAREYMRKRCARLDRMLDGAPWPKGWRPTGPVAVDDSGGAP